MSAVQSRYPISVLKDVDQRNAICDEIRENLIGSEDNEPSERALLLIEDDPPNIREFADFDRLETTVFQIAQRYREALVRDESAGRSSHIRARLESAERNLGAAARDLAALGPDAHRLLYIEIEKVIGTAELRQGLTLDQFIPNDWLGTDTKPLSSPISERLETLSALLGRVQTAFEDSGGRTSATRESFGTPTWLLTHDVWRLLCSLGRPPGSHKTRLFQDVLEQFHAWITNEEGRDFGHWIRQYISARDHHTELLEKAKRYQAGTSALDKSNQSFSEWIRGQLDLVGHSRPCVPDELLQAIGQSLIHLRTGPLPQRSTRRKKPPEQN